MWHSGLLLAAPILPVTLEWDVHYNTKGYYVTVSSTVEPEVVTVIADGGVRGEFYAFRIKKEELRNELERLEKLL